MHNLLWPAAVQSPLTWCQTSYPGLSCSVEGLYLTFIRNSCRKTMVNSEITNIFPCKLLTLTQLIFFIKSLLKDPNVDTLNQIIY